MKYALFFRNLLFVIAGCSLLATATASISFADDPSEPTALFLTWKYDPTTTMVIDWHREPDDEGKTTLYYKPVGGNDWEEIVAFQHFFPYSNRIINRAQLSGLEPDSEYRFRVGEFERKYTFRTMPKKLDRPVRFAVGGDTDHVMGGPSYKMNNVVMQYDLDFITWGGDLAYADGRPWAVDRWYGWFDVIKNTLIYDDGRVVPIVVGIGNHEVKRYIGGNQWYTFEDSIYPFEPTHEWRNAIAPFFYQLFAFPGHPGYDVLDFGDYMSLFILDSGHTNKVEGVQTEWLENELGERVRRNIPHIFPNYHKPAYPSHRSYNSRPLKDVRDNWVPLFEKYGVRVAFENHDHTYKRTHPIRDGEISSDGIVYIGDGNWGREPREGNSKDEWYIKNFASENNGIVVTLDGEVQKYIMYNNEGEVIDEYTDYP